MRDKFGLLIQFFGKNSEIFIDNLEPEYLGWRFYPIKNSTIVPRIYL